MRSNGLHKLCIPVMPDPIMHTSASCVRIPLLPSAAKGFTSGAESIQKDFVGLDAGRLAGGCDDGNLNTFCSTSDWFKCMDNAGIGVDDCRPTRISSHRAPASMNIVAVVRRGVPFHVAIFRSVESFSVLLMFFCLCP